MTITLTEEQFAAIESTLKAADSLTSAVISGKSGQMQLALSVARGLADIKKKKAVKL